jgi:putative pyruvate formate lyase activating enzyme
MKPTRREVTGAMIGAGLISITGTGCLASASEPLPVRPRKDFEPGYLALDRSGELGRRVAALKEIYQSCRLCPRECGVNRARGRKGVCRSGDRARVYSAHAHFGEERPLVGRSGSGTVFFSNCNLLCAFCQNWQINHRGDGTIVSKETLARMMLELQQKGCHNINLVTPTHQLPSIIEAVQHAARQGLRLPLVFNCGGYESVDSIRLLDGIVDLYLPDFKYMDGDLAAKYSHRCPDYPERAAESIKEMHRQVGNLVVDEESVALRGLILRHLVMPENIGGTDRFVTWVARELGTGTYVNIMGQYRPEHRARDYPELARRLNRADHAQAIRWAKEAGLRRIDGVTI